MYYLVAIALCLVGAILYPFYQCQTGRYHIRIAFYYFNFFMAAMLSCFVTPYTFLYSMGSVAPMTILHYLCQPWLDIEVEVRGAEKIARASGPDKKPVVLISNHQSSLDIYVMSYFWPEKCTCLIKSSLKYVPFFNLSAYMCNAVFVNRHIKSEAHKAVDGAVEEMKKNNIKVWVFPEGTRNHGTGLLPFKKGAFNIAVQAGFPIVPVVMSSYEGFYSMRKKYFNSGKVIVQVLDPVITSELSMENVPELCEEVRTNMNAVLKDISDEVLKRSETVSGKKTE